MSPEYVRPYVKAQKNDERDAEAIAEAATRPTMRFVELKSAEQLDMQTLHRSRSRLVGTRTMLINQMRAILLERGLRFPQGRRKLELAIDAMLAEPAAGIGQRLFELIADMRDEWRELDGRIAILDREFAQCGPVRSGYSAPDFCSGYWTVDSNSTGCSDWQCQFFYACPVRPP